ncbi:DCC1-like thiol-disulfide oxidoreductase family protein [Aquimarina celericrescens]|uniref:DCC1-like thiol-disulfide oxidoreductase family protein n=1 Tax=Aquimarina celericrescens TaxID=1964542 RepID=A0ABW5AZ38_9FLAO|nr:DUF393 domain-containing protein [Aquimarina celericrescens]
MERYFKKIAVHSFQKMPPQRLALLRIATGLFCLWYLVDRFGMLQRMVKKQNNFEPIGVLSWMDRPLSPEIFWWISIGVIALNLFYIIGWKFKVTGPLFAIILLLYFTYRNSWSMIYHNYNALIIHILILGFVASADAFSIDALKNKGKPQIIHWQYGWPVQLICIVTVGSYLLSGIAKLAGDLAWDWVSGTAMRSQVAVDAIRKEMLGDQAAPLFDVLFEFTWVFTIMGILTFILELGAPLALIKRRFGKIWAILTLMMHWGIFFMMGITFIYQMSGLLFLSFFEVEKLWVSSNKNSVNLVVPKHYKVKNSSPIILFDGVCNLCNRWIRFILNWEKNPRFLFASLQSDFARDKLKVSNVSNELSSIVFIKNGRVYQKSDAVLRIVNHLRFPWKLLSIFLILPALVRDFAYQIVASNRYKWFGKQQKCPMISRDQKMRFLGL